MSIFERRQYFVDPKVQGALVLRMLGYWVATIVTVTAMVLCWQVITRAEDQMPTGARALWLQCGGALIASAMLLPLILVDCVRMSNRIAGPLHRLRRCLRDLAADLPVPPIRFREGDLWTDVASEFNAVSAKLQQLQFELAELRGETPLADGIYVPPFEEAAILPLERKPSDLVVSDAHPGRTGCLPMQ
jgi:hypothetical protein